MSTNNPLYIYSGVAIGPSGDIIRDERKIISEDIAPSELKNAFADITDPYLRRISHFATLSLICCKEAVKKANIEKFSSPPLIFSTGLGELRSTVNFFKSVLDRENNFASPFDFVNSVNITTPFYIARFLELNSSTHTISQEELSFEYALLFASNTLKNKNTPLVIVGGIDEYLSPREIHLSRLSITDEQYFGEGGGFITLGSNSKNAIGEIFLLESFKNCNLHNRDSDTHRSLECTRLITEIISNHSEKKSKTIILPGFRISKDIIREIKNNLPYIEIENYLQYSGCFHTASAFGLTYVLDEKYRDPGNYFHLNCNRFGEFFLTGFQIYETI